MKVIQMLSLGWYEISLWLFSALAALFAFLSWRWMGLVSKEEREKLLNDLIIGSGYMTEYFEYRIGAIRIVEEEGWLYKARKILLGVFEGETTVALKFSGKGAFPSEEELNSSPYLQDSHSMREELGILEIQVHSRQRPTFDGLQPEAFQSESDEFDSLIPESLFQDKRIAVQFNTANPAELEERLSVLNQILKDVVSDENYLEQRFSDGN
jgi:hypothetical protein